MSTTFPSGLVAGLRKIRGSEITMLAEAVSGGQGRAADPFSAILGACWLRTVDPGPYGFLLAGSDAKPTTARFLKGDLLFGAIELRRMSVKDGDEFEFDAQCEECKHKIPWSLLLSDLPVRELSDEARAKVRSGTPFETTVLDENDQHRVVRFNLQTLEQEQAITDLMRKERRKRATMIDVLAAQATSIDGVAPTIDARRKFFATLGLDELQGLQRAMAEVDCGIDTAIEIECQECRWIQEVALPLDQRFLQPKKTPAPNRATTRPLGAASSPSSAASTSSGGTPSAPASSGSATAATGTEG